MFLYLDKIKFLLFSLLVLQFVNLIAQSELTQIKPFGTNPGNLKLMFYDPGNITEKAPLVVVLHGCTQTAEMCAKQSGWNKLALLHHFYVLYPEQIIVNNPENCFNWFRSNDQERDKGEPGSIKQMIDYMVKTKQIDTTRIFIVGLSAGAAMSTIMLSVYPEVFNKGGVLAGGPYKATESVLNSGSAMLGLISKSPENWGDLIRKQNPMFKGNYPKLAVVHGNKDIIVNPNNANQLIKQWINIHQTDYIEDEYFAQFKNYENIELSIYKNQNKEEVVRYYHIKDIGHTLPIDTGQCSSQGGKTGIFARDINFHSTFWIADYFGILIPPYSIQGNTVLKPNSINNSFSIPHHNNSSYQWNTPAGMWIQGEQHGNSISIQVDEMGGTLEVIETTDTGCMEVPSRISIRVE